MMTLHFEIDNVIKSHSFHETCGCRTAQRTIEWIAWQQLNRTPPTRTTTVRLRSSCRQDVVDVVGVSVTCHVKQMKHVWNKRKRRRTVRSIVACINMTHKWSSPPPVYLSTSLQYKIIIIARNIFGSDWLDYNQRFINVLSFRMII